jgi:hypothetical protein
MEVNNEAHRLPFEVRVLENGQTTGRKDSSSMLPATSRNQYDDIVIPRSEDIFYLEKELLIKRLNAIQRHMWLAGRPMPPRPLHHQRMLRREFVITEDIEHHLVWSQNRIFIKPILPFLLDPDFWTDHLLPRKTTENLNHSKRVRELEACARGFLHSYCALIAYPSDFRIAMDIGLLPDTVTWEGWKQLSAEIISNHCYASVNPRYWYGELRLGRLNKIYKLCMGSPLRGFSRVASPGVYGELLGDNFAALASILAYIAIVLTAMQVGLATDALQPSQAFQNASYGFTVFSIISPLIAAVAIFIFFLLMVISNFVVTIGYSRKRFREMGVDMAPKDHRGKTVDNDRSEDTENLVRD